MILSSPVCSRKKKLWDFSSPGVFVCVAGGGGVSLRGRAMDASQTGDASKWRAEEEGRCYLLAVLLEDQWLVIGDAGGRELKAWMG
jgi:hypothetical protein